MIGAADVLPMYPGYALGGVISKEEFLLPRLEKQVTSLYALLEKTEFEKEEEKKKESFKSLEEKEGLKVLNRYVAKIIAIKREIEKLAKKISGLLENSTPFAIQETFPLDYKVVELQTHSRSFNAERINHLIFTHTETNVHQRLESFVSSLFLQDASTSILPAGAIDSMANIVQTMLGTANTVVALIGSFISLDRVKVIDPLVMRKNTCLGNELVLHADNYYVLSEAILGGVFIGLGKSVSINQPQDESEKRAWAASLATINFISQGAIPKFNCTFEQVTLWNTYISWKNALMKEGGGYPIAFKVRRLDHVLHENDYKLPQNSTPKSSEILAIGVDNQKEK